MAPQTTYLNSKSTNVRMMIMKRSLTFLSLYTLWFIIPAIIKRFIYKQFFTPGSYRLSGSERDLLTTGERFRVMANSEKVECWKWGTGPAVIFVHGWGGRGIQFYPFFEKVMASGFSVVVFDGPAHGESEGKTCSYFQMTDAIRELIKHLRPENILGLAGHSFGAGAIINALEKEKLRLPAVLIAPALKIKELLEYAISTHGIPFSIYNKLIRKYEVEYNYNLENDNPVNLLQHHQSNMLVIHDVEDRVVPFLDSKHAVDQYTFLELFKTSGLGHKRLLTDPAIIEKTVSYLKKTGVPTCN